MEATTSTGSEIREFTIDVPEEQLEDLRSRINATKWPDREVDPSQGVQLETIQALASYWATDYDWRKFEERFAALPHFITEIDGVDIHFIHVRSEHEDALPLIVTHGWPGSTIEQLKIIDPLTNPDGARRERGGRLPSRDPVAAGPRVLGQADRDRLGPHSHRAGVGRADGAPRIHRVRGAGRRLGQCRHRADGSAEAPGPAGHPHQHAGDRSARRLEGARVRRSEARRASRPTRRRRTRSWSTSSRPASATPTRWRTARRRSTASRTHRSAWRPGCSTTTCASYELIARAFVGEPGGLSRDDVLDNVTHYWLTNSGVSSARLYWESHLAFFDVKGVEIPVGVTVFPDELYPAPRSWAEKAYPKLIHFNEVDEGGHFAAWEQPQILSEEIRATFRSLR